MRERATKSREVFVRRVLNKQDEGLFRKSREASLGLSYRFEKLRVGEIGIPL